MTLTAQLIELIESKAIGKKENEVASWFVLDAIANFESAQIVCSRTTRARGK